MFALTYLSPSSRPYSQFYRCCCRRRRRCYLFQIFLYFSSVHCFGLLAFLFNYFDLLKGQESVSERVSD